MSRHRHREVNFNDRAPPFTYDGHERYEPSGPFDPARVRRYAPAVVHGARVRYVAALLITVAGSGGWIAHQNAKDNQFTADQAAALSAQRNRYEDLLKNYTDLSEHCVERALDALEKDRRDR